MDLRHAFIQGNHDDPYLCKAHPNFLGRFGYLPDDDLFYLSGAQTASWRVLGNSKYWYRNEELSEAEFEEAIKLYKKVRPRVLIAHEFPSEAVPELLRGLCGNYFTAKADCATSRTCVGLQWMLESHRPERFFGGHYHVSREFTLNGTVFPVPWGIGIVSNRIRLAVDEAIARITVRSGWTVLLSIRQIFHLEADRAVLMYDSRSPIQGKI